MKPKPFDIKFRLSNSGLFYLIVIALVSAAMAGAFQKDDGILLIPVLFVIGSMLVAMWVRHQSLR